MTFRTIYAHGISRPLEEEADRRGVAPPDVLREANSLDDRFVIEGDDAAPLALISLNFDTRQWGVTFHRPARSKFGLPHKAGPFATAFDAHNHTMQALGSEG